MGFWRTARKTLSGLFTKQSPPPASAEESDPADWRSKSLTRMISRVTLGFTNSGNETRDTVPTPPDELGVVHPFAPRRFATITAMEEAMFSCGKFEKRGFRAVVYLLLADGKYVVVPYNDGNQPVDILR